MGPHKTGSIHGKTPLHLRESAGLGEELALSLVYKPDIRWIMANHWWEKADKIQHSQGCHDPPYLLFSEIIRVSTTLHTTLGIHQISVLVVEHHKGG